MALKSSGEGGGVGYKSQTLLCTEGWRMVGCSSHSSSCNLCLFCPAFVEHCGKGVDISQLTRSVRDKVLLYKVILAMTTACCANQQHCTGELNKFIVPRQIFKNRVLITRKTVYILFFGILGVPFSFLLTQTMEVSRPTLPPALTSWC